MGDRPGDRRLARRRRAPRRGHAVHRAAGHRPERVHRRRRPAGRRLRSVADRGGAGGLGPGHGRGFVLHRGRPRRPHRRGVRARCATKRKDESRANADPNRTSCAPTWCASSPPRASRCRRCRASTCASTRGELVAVVGASGSGKSTLLDDPRRASTPRPPASRGSPATTCSRCGAASGSPTGGAPSASSGSRPRATCCPTSPRPRTSRSPMPSRAGRREPARAARVDELLDLLEVGDCARPPPGRAVGRPAAAGRDRGRARQRAAGAARRRADRRARRGDLGRTCSRRCATSTASSA